MLQPSKLVIELDDKSHRLESSRQRDAFKDAAPQAAGLPIQRVPVGRYDLAWLSGRIDAMTLR
jgi:very-short-patch-repair endonuclease